MPVIVKTTFTIALLAFLVSNGKMEIQPLETVFTDWSWGLAFVAIIANLFLQSFRWNCILKAQGLVLPIAKTLRLQWISQFFVITSIGAVGGEVARGYYVSRHFQEDQSMGVATVLFDRLLGLATYLLLGAVCLLLMQGFGVLGPGMMLLGGACTALLAILIVVVILFFSPLFSRIFSLLPLPSLRMTLSTIAHGYRLGGRWNVGALLASFVASLLFILAFYAVARALGGNGSFASFLLATPLVILANNLPVSIGGLGVGEAAAEAIMAQMGIAQGAAIMFFIRMLMWIIVLPLGGTFYVMESPKKL